ncbi:MAG: DUF2853 family protein, partial [Pseudomonadota bacterium]
DAHLLGDEVALDGFKLTVIRAVDDAQLQKLADSMKMVIENRDALYVAGTDDSELETVQRNFIAKKMGIDDKDKGMEIARAVASKMSAIQMKNRAAFYYLCMKHG